MGKKFEIKNGDISDGYHTFDELYKHRVNLFMVLIRYTDWPCFMVKNHYPEWDAVYLETPLGQISYHLPWTKRETIINRVKVVDKHDWDGHDSNEVLFRLQKLAFQDKIK